MSNELETFFQAHQFTINAVSAISTFAAVVVSLAVSYLAERAQRTRLTASVEINLIIERGAEDDPPSYVIASVRNIGNIPARILQTFFFWSFPLQRAGWITLPRDASGMDDRIPLRIYPVVIEPRTTTSFVLFELGSFREIFLREYRKASWFKRLKFRFIGARVTSDDGRTFNVKIGDALKKEMHSLVISGPKK